MNALTGKSYEALIDAPFQERTESAWLQQARKAAFERFKEKGFPTRQMEAWKYMNLKTVLETPFAASAERQGYQVVGGDSPVFVRKIEEAQGFFGFAMDEETNPFVDINTFSFSSGVFLHIPKDMSLEDPVRLQFKAEGNAAAPPVSYPRLLIVAEPGAKATVILEHQDLSDAPYFLNAVVEVIAGRNSHVKLINIQNEDKGAYQIVTTRVRQMEGSHFESVSFTSGGVATRDEVFTQFEGPNADCSVMGLSLLDGASQAFHHATVFHKVPSCTSRQVYKNILAGTSQAEFNSLVHVYRGANGSDSQQLDRNLLLSNAARAYSRPQLKIDADDVKANHGAATGQLEQNELFYLRSRGLDKNFARYLLTFGFAREILNAIEPPPLREKLEALAGDKIRRMITPSLSS